MKKANPPLVGRMDKSVKKKYQLICIKICWKYKSGWSGQGILSHPPRPMLSFI